jgi:trans-2,3-dihydro-3-hydroxyanthranilate isomerase
MPAEPTHPYTIVDVFTDTPMQGNPLAVFTQGESVPSRLMLAAARELNLSETVFVLPGDDDADAMARIFTPRTELPYAGHPVLGTAFIVGERGNLDTVRLRTGAGIVSVRLTRELGEIVYAEMEQPLPVIAPVTDPRAFLDALGVGGAELPIEVYTNGPEHVMVALASAEQVMALGPEPSAVVRAGELSGLANPAVSCFAKTGLGRFKTRVFCPALGVVEDPATGSAAGPLALHAARHGWSRAGERIEIVQGVELERPSKLSARIEGTAQQPSRILVGGSAVTVAHGHFRLQ